MSPWSRLAMNLYYLAAEAAVAATGLRRDRIVRMARVLGWVRTRVGYVGPKKSRQVFLDHIAQAAPHLERPARERLLADFWFYHQLRFLDLFVVHRAPPQHLLGFVEYQGLEHLSSALAGRGAIAVTLHMGDPRMVHIALALKGFPVHVLSARYDQYGSRGREARLRASRRYHHVHFLDEPLRWAHRALGENHVVFMAMSGYAGPRGQALRFLNAPILFSTGPARLSLSTGAPLVPVVDLVDARGRHHVRVYPPVPQPQEGAVADVTQRLVTLFEGIASAHLDQVDWVWYVIRCQEYRGEVEPYEEGKMVRTGRR